MVPMSAMGSVLCLTQKRGRKRKKEGGRERGKERGREK